MLCCQKTSAEVNLLPNPYSCLERDQKENIAVCFEQNFDCHEALKSIAKDEKSDWQSWALAFGGGIIAEMILANQLHH